MIYFLIKKLNNNLLYKLLKISNFNFQILKYMHNLCNGIIKLLMIFSKIK